MARRLVGFGSGRIVKLQPRKKPEKMDFSMKPWTRNEQLRYMRANGERLSKIGNTFGITVARASQVAKGE